MKILSWNCQELGNPWTVRNLRKIVKEQGPLICFLMEIKLDREGINFWCKDLPYNNKFVVKKPGLGGGFAMMWKEDVSLDVFKYSNNQIAAMVTESNGFRWVLIGFYGWPETQDRYKSWALLTHICSLVDGAWICISDFNEMFSLTEKLSCRPTPPRQLDAFCEPLELCNLVDLGFIGYKFTWNNRRLGAANTKERLDRAVANEVWRSKFPGTIVTHIISYASDHLPLILQNHVPPKSIYKGRRGFKFEEAWLLWVDCEKVI